MASQPLLAHIVSKFAPRQWENVASETLRYLLLRDGGPAGLRALLEPLGFHVNTLNWRAQATSSDDPSIPDLVGDDSNGRHAVIIEAKFWAGLTPNQPVAYLQRQRAQFPGSPREHVLVFLVPTSRKDLVAAELSRRLEVPVRRIGRTPVLTSEGAQTVVITWEELLSQLEVAFTAAQDSSAIEDLAQLRGLCSKADSVAMMPLAAEDVGSDRGRRYTEFCRAVDSASRRLLGEEHYSTPTKYQALGRYGYRLKDPWGRTIRLFVSAKDWAHEFPTPWWIKASDVSPAACARVESLSRQHPIVQKIIGGENRLKVGVVPPLGVEEHVLVERLVQATKFVSATIADE